MIHQYLIFYILLLNKLCITTSIIDHKGNELIINTPRLFTGPEKINVFGKLVVAKPFSACEELDKEKANGKILIIEEDNCSPETKIVNAQEAGAIGVLIRQYRSTTGLLFYYSNMRNRNLLPAVEITSSDLSEVLLLIEASEIEPNITITAGSNPIEEFGELPWAIYTTILFVYGFPILIFAIYKLFHWITTTQKNNSILPILILSLDIFAGIIRLPILLDPSATRRILPWPLIEFFLTVDFSIIITANLVLSFYWYAVMITWVNVLPSFSLQRLKWPCVCICSSLVLLELITSVLRALWFSAMGFLIVKVALYFILSLSVSIFFFYTSYKIYNHFNQAGKETNLKRQTTIVIICGVSIILFMLTVPLVPSPLYSVPSGYFLLRFLVSIWIYTASLMHVLLFVVPLDNKNKISAQTEIPMEN